MAGGLTLNVDTLSKIPSLEKALKSGRINIILVFAEWCGACHKFRKNIWNPMLRKNALHNRIAVRDDVIGKTSLLNTKFDYLPSILVVDEKGVAQTFNTPEGKVTNAMPTPKSLNDMTRVVNVPVAATTNLSKNTSPNMNTAEPSEPSAPTINLTNVAVRKNADPTALMEEISANIRKNSNLPTAVYKNLNSDPGAPEENDTLLPNESPLLNSVPPPAPKKQSVIPQGVVFTPTPLVAPQRGGSLLAALESTVQGAVPATVLGGLLLALRGGGRRRQTKRARKVDRRTRRNK
jgi:hypothetical protein